MIGTIDNALAFRSVAAPVLPSWRIVTRLVTPLCVATLSTPADKPFDRIQAAEFSAALLSNVLECDRELLFVGHSKDWRHGGALLFVAAPTEREAIDLALARRADLARKFSPWSDRQPGAWLVPCTECVDDCALDPVIGWACRARTLTLKGWPGDRRHARYPSDPRRTVMVHR